MRNYPFNNNYFFIFAPKFALGDINIWVLDRNICGYKGSNMFEKFFKRFCVDRVRKKVVFIIKDLVVKKYTSPLFHLFWFPQFHFIAPISFLF